MRDWLQGLSRCLYVSSTCVGPICMFAMQVLHAELEDLLRLLEDYRTSVGQRNTGALPRQPHALVA